MQVHSLSYHAASGTVAVGLDRCQVIIWQTSLHISPSAALQCAKSAHVCARERLAEAQAQVKDIEASLEKADSGLRQQMSREQELKLLIAEPEAKCAHIFWCTFASRIELLMFSGE